MNSANFIWRPDDYAWTRESYVVRFTGTRGIATIAEIAALARPQPA